MSEVVLPQSFPDQDYTPHGYIDNPYHSMVLSRSGVLRSVPPLGFGYWHRYFKGSYGSGVRGHVNYLALMNLAVAVDNVRLTSAADFKTLGVHLGSRYHSKNMLSYDWQVAGLTCSAKYYLTREHSLSCRFDVTNPGERPRELHLHATLLYGLWEQDRRWWGSNGLAGRYDAAGDAGVGAIWAYGDYIALGADAQSVAHKSTGSEPEWQGWLTANDLTSNDGVSMFVPATAPVAGPLYVVQSYKLTVPAEGAATLLLGLSRGTNEPWAVEELKTGLRQAPAVLEQLLDEDEAFWSRCPALDGDWPAAWKRGWVYDYETLRMTVRRPLGIFEHHWDGMQIHSPRSVLGEAAVDMLALSYADPDLARDVMYGTFADAPQAQVPCTREDGSMNMIAADGSACGTAPSWCFPFHVLRAIHAATGDDTWVAALYPHMKEFLEWWFKHRMGAEGFFHCKCDWESGQDGSKRFPLPEGGSAENVRAVDVEASMAEALRIMAEFAKIADVAEDIPYWTKLAEKRRRATHEMFVDGWYYDFDVRTNTPIKLDYRDGMMLAPLTCRTATAEHIEALRPTFQHFRDHPLAWFEWPSFMLALTEAAWTAELQVWNAENIADIADRVYGRTDARELYLVDAGQPFAWRIPGVANEYWPIDPKVEPGGEGYGWGATLPLHVIRVLIGLRELDPEDAAHMPDASEFTLAPALPRRFLKAGQRYTMTNLRFRDAAFSVTYEPADAGGALRIALDMVCENPVRCVVWHGEKTVCDLELETGVGPVEFAGRNGDSYRVAVQETEPQEQL